MGQCIASDCAADNDALFLLEIKYEYFCQVFLNFTEEEEVKLPVSGFQSIYELIEFFCYLPADSKLETLFAGYTFYRKRNQIRVEGLARKYKTRDPLPADAYADAEKRIFYTICVIIDIVNIECLVSEELEQWEKTDFMQAIKGFKAVKPYNHLVRTMFNLSFAENRKCVSKIRKLKENIEESKSFLSQEAKGGDEEKDILECTRLEIIELENTLRIYQKKKQTLTMLSRTVMASTRHMVPYRHPDWLRECHCNICEVCVL